MRFIIVFDCIEFRVDENLNYLIDALNNISPTLDFYSSVRPNTVT